MRIRRKPWARPELAACPFYVQDPAANRGQWAAAFPARRPVHLELGCGKGTFIAALAAGNPQINYIAVDIKSEVLALAKRCVERTFAEAGRPVDNVLLLSHDIERIHLMLDAQDPVERIYINFCNPWTEKQKHRKHRLTHPRQLTQYKQFLVKGGEIWFKTDNDILFEESLGYFRECGFTIRYETRDLHQSGFANNIQTEHERMFTEKGIPTKFLIAVSV